MTAAIRTNGQTLTEHGIQRAVASWVDWQRVTVVPNLTYWHEMDVAVLTKAGYLWEFEIKVSQADWNRDRKKDEAGTAPPWAKGNQEWEEHFTKPHRRLDYVKRFTYVYAKGLKCPDWVPAWAGLLEASIPDGERYVYLDPIRWPENRKVEKAPEKLRLAMLTSIYFRYWRRQPT